MKFQALRALVLFSMLCFCTSCASMFGFNSKASFNEDAISGFKIHVSESNMQANKKLFKQINDKYPANNIQVVIYESSILLTGQIDRLEDRVSAESTIKSYSNAKLYNYLQVLPIESSAQIDSDVRLSAEAIQRLSLLNGIDSNSKIELVTTNSVIYIFGLVTNQLGMVIVNELKSIDGVTNVIPLFNYTESAQ